MEQWMRDEVNAYVRRAYAESNRLIKEGEDLARRAKSVSYCPHADIYAHASGLELNIDRCRVCGFEWCS